jgi:hypothetical protein
MKINYLFAILLLVLGCKEGPKQDALATEAGKTEQSTETTKATAQDLKQNGDYSSFFNHPDCKVITAEELSTVLGLSFVDMNLKNACSFKSQLTKDKTWYLSVMLNDMSKSDIQREIDSYKSDETGLLAWQTSETGDTYLCNQHSHGYLSIYNPMYNRSALIRYGSVAESRGFTAEERLQHRDMALKLANALLKKHQK